MKKGICQLGSIGFAILVTTSILAGAEKQNFVVTVHVNAQPPEVSPDGFVDGSDRWLQDSVEDLKKALDGKEFTPNKSCPGSRTQYRVVNDGSNADITLTVAARGTSSTTLGQRTTMQFYKGVVLADTAPTIGITRWVSIVLSVASYRKEFLAWSTNQSKWSLGAWTDDAKLLASGAACWVMVNETRIRERRNNNPAAGDSLSNSSQKTAISSKSGICDSECAPVYFYRRKSGFDSMANPTVRCDGTDLARLEKGQFFAFYFSAGEHECQLVGSTASHDPVHFNINAGLRYFLRYEGGLTKRLAFVDLPTAQTDGKNLKPIESGAVKNPQVTAQPLP